MRGAAICESEQTTSNLAIVAAVFARIAALINSTIIIEDGVRSLLPSYITKVSTQKYQPTFLFPFQAAQDLVNMLGSLQQWNEDVLRTNSSK